jgi:hypothetical protein
MAKNIQPGALASARAGEKSFLIECILSTTSHEFLQNDIAPDSEDQVSQ